MITVLCPVYNEQDYIVNVLEFFVKAEPADKELIIIDGNSSDKTVEIIKSWMANHPNIKLLSNPQKYVPYALNLGINNSTGNPIIRLDAHTLYSDDYFLKIIDTFSRREADIVGGPMRAVGKTTFQKAVAYCTSTKLGVGDSSFHDDQAEGYVDSVYLGAWKRSVFNDAGLFDEDMMRNQDDEFHYRAKSLGKKIYLNPAIKSWYFPRSSVKKLFSQYFQYGLYKPLVIKKVSSEIKIRHIIPSLFVLYFIFLPLLYIIMGSYVLIPFLLYVILDLAFSAQKVQSLSEFFYRLLIYPCLHLSYGLGFILGMKFFLKREK